MAKEQGRMSKKSKRRRAIKKGARRARRDYGDVMATRYYRRWAKHDGRCACCGRRVKQGDPIAYRKAGSVVLWLPHAEADPHITLYDSASWALSGR
jgi:hypothetical protein